MSQKYYLGIDLGTSSVKAVLCDEDANIIAHHAIAYPLQTPKPQIAEQDPEIIFKATIDVIRATIRHIPIHSLQFISFSSAMHSFIAVDHNGIPLTQNITWADTRSAPYVDRILEQYAGHDIYKRTGTPIHAMSPFVKLVWFKEEHPDLFQRATKFISIKEYIFYKLFGTYIVDHSIASATGLLNIHTLTWDDKALAVAGIREDQLSTIVPTTFHITGLHKKYREAMGLTKDIPFIIGASDGVLANVGVGAVDPGVVALTIGTSGAIRTITNQPKTDLKGRTFCYALTESHWVIGAPVNSGGIILRWLKDEVMKEETNEALQVGMDPYDHLTEIAANIEPGSAGLIFHPFLAGERAPLWNANARGSFFGLGLHHKKAHLIRAVLEGITYNLYTVLLMIEELIGQQTRIHATGGFTKSAMWRQLLTDVFNRELVVPQSFDSSCLGAVILGMLATGKISHFHEMTQKMICQHVHHPISEHVTIYQEIFPIYQRLTHYYKHEYETLVQIQRKYE